MGYAKGPNCSQTDTCQCAVIGLTAAVKRENADILLIAGDLFDHARLPDTAITRTLEILAEAGVPVAVIPGNHDVHDMTSLWTRCADEVKKTGIFLLDCLEGASVRFGSLGLTLWGRAMAEHEPGYRPLFEVPSRPVSDWYVVAAHGHLNLTSEDAHRSSPITSQSAWAIVMVDRLVVVVTVTAGNTLTPIELARVVLSLLLSTITPDVLLCCAPPTAPPTT